MDVLMVLLRLIHIVSGVFWAGAIFFMVSFITPSVAATGEEGRKFMQYLGLRTRLSTAFLIAATLTALSGLIMYLILFGPDAVTSTYSVVLGIAGVAGLTGWVLGYVISYRTIARMKVVSGQIQAANKPPSPDQLSEMQALSERLTTGTRVTAVLLTIAVVGMAVAQYLG